MPHRERDARGRRAAVHHHGPVDVRTGRTCRVTRSCGDHVAGSRETERGAMGSGNTQGLCVLGVW